MIAGNDQYQLVDMTFEQEDEIIPTLNLSDSSGKGEDDESSEKVEATPPEEVEEVKAGVKRKQPPEKQPAKKVCLSSPCWL